MHTCWRTIATPWVLVFLNLKVVDKFDWRLQYMGKSDWSTLVLLKKTASTQGVDLRWPRERSAEHKNQAWAHWVCGSRVAACLRQVRERIRRRTKLSTRFYATTNPSPLHNPKRDQNRGGVRLSRPKQGNHFFVIVHVSCVILFACLPKKINTHNRFSALIK